MAMKNYCERTGPVFRFGVIADNEDEAIAFAEEAMSASFAWVDQGRPTFNEWEVVFEAGDIL